jgi:tetratricopeptide (TPR) repeat protein
MSTSLENQGKINEAKEALNKAISLNPDHAEAHQNLSYTLLNEGKLKEGLDKYEWRWKKSNNIAKQRHFLQPMWDGKQSLNGKRILLWCEQGLGDTIIWSSRLSLVTSHTKHCILECQPKLVPLLKRSFPNVEVKAEDRRLDLQRDDFDFHLPMGSLYKNFIQELSKTDKVDAYLVPDPVRVDYWKERLKSLGKGPFIGISWKSAKMDMIRLPNYATISELFPILRTPNVTFINLQYIDFAKDLSKVHDDLGVTVHNFDDLDHFNNIDDVAALCTALDMVVSTKTTVPLISAAVGTSTKLANWKQSPWNNVLLNPVGSLVDIFERDTWEPWDNVFNSIAEDLFTTTKIGVLYE